MGYACLWSCYYLLNKSAQGTTEEARVLIIKKKGGGVEKGNWTWTSSWCSHQDCWAMLKKVLGTHTT